MFQSWAQQHATNNMKGFEVISLYIICDIDIRVCVCIYTYIYICEPTSQTTTHVPGLGL